MARDKHIDTSPRLEIGVWPLLTGPPLVPIESDFPLRLPRVVKEPTQVLARCLQLGERRQLGDGCEDSIQ